MKVEINRRTVKWIFVGLAIVIAIVLMVMAYRRRSNLVWPIPDGTTPDAYDTNLQTILAGYQDDYNLALIDAMKRPVAERPALILTAETTLNTAINAAVVTYVSNKCPAAAGTPPASSDTAATGIWNDYQTDLGKVQKAYYLLLKDASASTTPTAAQIQYARQADITGATRKYMAKRCPSFYYVSVTDDPTSTYTAWTTSAAASKPATGYGIHTPSVTTANVTAWLPYAASVFTSTGTTVTAAAGATSVAIPLVSATGISVGNTIQFTYQTMDVTGALTTPSPVNATVASIDSNTVTLTIPGASVASDGMIIPSGSLFAKAYRSGDEAWKNVDANGVPNWKKARDAGPGTYPTPSWA